MTSGAGRTITYNASELTATATEGSSTVSYTYDTSNQRAVQTTPTETTHYYGFGDNAHSELQDFTAGGSTWIDYIHSPTGLMGAVHCTPGSNPSTTTTQYFAADHLGSIAASVVSDGSNPQERSYDAWGKQRFPSGVDDTGNTLMTSNASTDGEPRGFIGQEQVGEVNLVDLNRRMYDPWVGRFLSADSVIASPGDAQALNPYSYAGNNPLTNLDPSGASWFSSFFKHNSQALISWGLTAVRVVVSIVAMVVTMGAFATAAGYSSISVDPEFAAESAGQYTVSAYSAMAADSPASAMADAAISGAVGGAINTGTLRGTLVGAATAEAFWGVGEIKDALGASLANNPGVSPAAAGGIYGASSVALHAAVGCVSSAAGGRRCGSGAISGGLGEITSGYAVNFRDNVFVQSAIVGLGGGAGSVLTGGRFGDGFFIAASGYAFNELADAWAGSQAATALAAKLNSLGGNWSAEPFVWYDTSTWGRADLVDNVTKEVYELKTWNTFVSQRGVDAAAVQVARYAQAGGYSVGQNVAQFDGLTAIGMVRSVPTTFYYGGPAPGLVEYVNASASESWYYQLYRGTSHSGYGGMAPMLAPGFVMVPA